MKIRVILTQIGQTNNSWTNYVKMIYFNIVLNLKIYGFKDERVDC